MGWISDRHMRSGGSIGPGGLSVSKKGAPLRRIVRTVIYFGNLFKPDVVLLECGHEAESWGGGTGSLCRLQDPVELRYNPKGMSQHGTNEAARHSIARSSHWPSVQRAFLVKNPFCACCADPVPGTPVQVHHKFPFHYCVALGRPDLELDERNLITLCETEAGRPSENHHLLVGHAGDFRSSNINVEMDVTTFHGMAGPMIKTSAAWRMRVSNRLKSLDQMTTVDRAEFLARMYTMYPPLG